MRQHIRPYRLWGALLVLTLALALFIPGAAHPARAAASDLIISEYIEGSSNNKAIEIYNGTGSSVNLSQYRYEICFDYDAACSNFTTLSGTLLNDEVYVIAHPLADEEILDVADATSTLINFSGDDTVRLIHTGVGVVDSIGQAGFDPGTAWTVGSGATAEFTLVRKPEVCTGDSNSSDTFTGNDEWIVFARDTFTELGFHDSTCLLTGNEPDLTVSIGESADPIGVNNTVTYTFTVTNEGTDDAENAELTATFSGVTFAFASTPAAECDIDVDELFCDIGTVANGTPYQTTIEVTAQSAGTLTVEVDVLADSPEITNNNSDTETTTVNAVEPTEPDLIVSVNDTPDPVNINNVVTYAVQVTNQGDATATNAVVVVDFSGSAFPGDFGTITGTGCVETDADTVTCTIGTLAADGVYNASIPVTPITAGSITASATVSADAPEIDSNNTGDASTTVTDPGGTQPGAFNLIGPADNPFYRDLADLTALTWETATNALNYNVQVIKISDNARLGTVLDVDVLPAACATTCSLTLTTQQKTDLGSGSFVWTVFAENGDKTTEASNAGFRFAINTGSIRMISDAGFEGNADGKRLPKGWKKVGPLKGDKVVCNTTTTVAHSGSCAYQFKGRPGEFSGLRQVVPFKRYNLEAGDKLTLSAFVDQKTGKKNQVVVLLKVVYKKKSLGSDKLRIKLPAAAQPGYVELVPSADLTIKGVVKKITVTVQYGAGKGTYVIDDVNVILRPVGATLPGGDGLLPVPSAPADLRGSN